MLSIIIVNYNSSEVLKECFSSINRFCNDQPIEILIVDSGSEELDKEKLKEIRDNKVRIIFANENIGYAKAVNLGIKNSQGQHILISNPDVIYLKESIQKMSDALRQIPNCGAVAPKTWWNYNRDFLLPKSEIITPFGNLLIDLARSSRAFYEAFFKRWVKRNLVFWLTDKPLKQEMLSGACIMTKKEVIESIGGFDEGFSLYFEDTDWSIRMLKSGYDLYLIPDSEVIHLYNQSAKKDKSAAEYKFNLSMQKYFIKHFSFQSSLVNFMKKLLSQRLKAPSSIRYEIDLGLIKKPPFFKFESRGRKLLLLSPLEVLIPSAGAFIEDDSFMFPPDLWDCLGEGRYFLRCLLLDSLRYCGSWTWIKG
ncbi:MAG: glycosyltransferase family 2 protein [Thermodesulfovibrionales bacterium]|nr:glycosyltransferase family 2 protein [Thermodesulfovibrionales bacterium]